MLLVWNIWCLLIGISVLTTYQHHFIDIPTGALLGFFALWLFPAGAPSPLSGYRLKHDATSRRIGGYYAAASLALFLIVVLQTRSSALFLFLLWPALALGIVSLGYLGAGAKVFEKRADGTISFASRWLLAPYRLVAIVNSHLWTRQLAPSVLVFDGVHLGRLPKHSELSAFATVIDLTGELAKPSHVEIAWQCFPSLDLVPVSPDDLEKASDAIETGRSRGPVLVCCALGFQRSAAAVGTWLLRQGHAATAAQAIALLKTTGRPIHLREDMIVAGETGARHG